MKSKIGLKDENGKFYFGWYVVIMGFILMIFGYACIVSVSGVFTLPVTEDLGLQIGDFVIWMTIQSLAAIIVLLVIQKNMTQKMIKPIMIVSAVCGAAGMFGFSRSTELWHFYLFAVLLGICMSGLTSTPCTVLVTNWFGTKVRGVALSLVFGGTSLGCMANPEPNRSENGVENRLSGNRNCAFSYMHPSCTGLCEMGSSKQGNQAHGRCRRRGNRGTGTDKRRCALPHWD